MPGRLTKGLQILEKGLVKLFFKDDELIQFEVQGSKGETYLVARYLDNWICDCHDYKIRYNKEPGSYECKHIRACQLELAMILIFGEDYNLEKLKEAI